jgi:nucleotide-binding universal stress UspA family protein
LIPVIAGQMAEVQAGALLHSGKVQHVNRQEAPTRHGSTLRRLMIAVDDSTASMQALRFAARVAPRDAEVRIVCAAEAPRGWTAGGAYTAADGWMTDTLVAARDELRRDAERTLEQAMVAFEGHAASVEGHIADYSGETADVAHALADAARGWRADVLVVGARHRGRLQRWADGSVSGALAVCAPCPLLVVPREYEARGEGHLARMLFATDGSPASAQAIQAGLRVAGPQTALRATYVADRSGMAGDPMTGSALEDVLSGLGQKALADARAHTEAAGVACETALVGTGIVRDDIAQALLRDADDWQADLVVLGTRGRRGVARWLLGSVAQRAAEITRLPLLLVGPAAG